MIVRRRRRSKATQSLVRAVIEKFFITLFMGIIVFGILVVGSQAPVVGSLFRSVQAYGVNLGMRLAAELEGETAEHGQRYLLLNIDDQACATLVPEQERARRCRVGAPADREIVAALVQGSRQGGAKVVVLDLLSEWPSGDEHDPLRGAFLMAGASPLVIPLRWRWEPFGHGRIVVSRDASAPMPSGPGEQLPYMALPRGSPLDNGVVRRYAPSHCARDDILGSRERPVWSMPNLAACLARGIGQPSDLSPCNDVPPPQ
jgi:CHASE2 domain-containing sensor protein